MNSGQGGEVRGGRLRSSTGDKHRSQMDERKRKRRARQPSAVKSTKKERRAGQRTSARLRDRGHPASGGQACCALAGTFQGAVSPHRRADEAAGPPESEVSTQTASAR